MKDITFSLDEELIEAVEKRAQAEHTTLEELFRVWLEDYVQRGRNSDEAIEPD